MHTLLIEGTLKPGKRAEFLTIWNKEILTTLKKQNGFVDEILLFSEDDPNCAVGISLWNAKEDAERYHRDVFPRMINTLQQIIDTPPTVRAFNVESSETFRVAEGKAA
jgi:quinol monooxygenase YgiN